VSVDPLIEGPMWVASGLDESRGLYPLRVEGAIGSLVELLLPGVITTTTGARYFGLHTLAWADAERRELGDAEAEEFVRRCEVVMAAASWAHGQDGGHVRRVPEAHGEGNMPRYIDGGVLRVAAAAEPGAYSNGGFAGTYAASERVIGLLRGGWPPRTGPRVDLGPLTKGLGDVLELAREDEVPLDVLTSATHLCPCRAAGSADGEWLRQVMFERADPAVEGDRNRQITAMMLLEALEGGPHGDPEGEFRLRHGYGPAIPEGDAEARARRGWRAAILRNSCVSAWRHIWSWLSEQLVGDQLSIDDLADRLADAVPARRVSDLIDSLPQRKDATGLLPVEEELRWSDEPVPQRSLRLLALGAQRLQDLDDDTRSAFLGRSRDDLGPLWVDSQLREHADAALADFARDLVTTLVRRAHRVAHSKMRLDRTTLKPYLPTRLRDRDGLLWVVGAEPDAEVSLRGWTLAQVLTALGAIDRPDGEYEVSADGALLVERIRASLGAPA
jgi:hypothetical protein